MLDGPLGKAQYYTLCTEFQESSKLKMVKKQGQNIPMKVAQKKDKQTKFLHFLDSCNKNYQMMKPEKV